MFMFNWLKLSHYRHSGRLRPHEHTSYVPLGLLLLVVGLALIASTVQAATPYTGPEAGSVGLTGIMPGKPPTVAAVIQSPVSQKHFSISPDTFSGTCPTNTLVELFKNNIFAGSTPCTDAGVYSLDVDLMIGKNVMVAKVYDALNQTGPDSNKITVYYDALPVQSGALTLLDFGGSQLLINTDAIFRGSFPKQTMNVPISILGGTPPYAVNVQWGDSNNKVVSLNDNTTFNVGHAYLKPGTYQISIQVSDTKGRVAFLTVASIINGQPSPATIAASTADTTNKLLVLWPLYASAVAVVISFFIGEKREKRVLGKHGLLLTQ